MLEMIICISTRNTKINSNAVGLAADCSCHSWSRATELQLEDTLLSTNVCEWCIGEKRNLFWSHVYDLHGCMDMKSANIFGENRNEGKYVLRVSQYGVATTVPKLLVSGMHRSSGQGEDLCMHVARASDILMSTPRVSCPLKCIYGHGQESLHAGRSYMCVDVSASRQYIMRTCLTITSLRLKKVPGLWQVPCAS
jgi:hypothetical protein